MQNIQDLTTFFWFSKILFGGIFIGLIFWQVVVFYISQRSARMSSIDVPLFWLVMGGINIVLLLGSFIWLIVD